MTGVYKFITIKQVNEEVFNKRPVYRIFSNKDNSKLGILSYYTSWRRYVFSTKTDYVFDKECLKCIWEFLDTEIPKIEKRKSRIKI